MLGLSRHATSAPPTRFRRPVGRGRASLQLIERLGLQSQTLVSSPSARSRYIMQDGRLERLPTSVWGAVTSPLTRSLPWAALADLRVPRRQGDEVRCPAILACGTPRVRISTSHARARTAVTRPLSFIPG